MSRILVVLGQFGLDVLLANPTREVWVVDADALESMSGYGPGVCDLVRGVILTHSADTIVVTKQRTLGARLGVKLKDLFDKRVCVGHYSFDHDLMVIARALGFQMVNAPDVHGFLCDEVLRDEN